MERHRPRNISAKRAARAGRVVKCVLGCALLSVLSACAYSYLDSDGTQHIIGLVNMQIRPTNDNETLAGDVVDVTSVGIAYHSASENTSLTVGYSRNVTAALRDNVLVMGNPLTALDANSSHGTGLEADDE